MFDDLRMWLAGGLAWLVSLNLGPSPTLSTVSFPEPALTALVADSYKEVPGSGKTGDFFQGLDQAYLRTRKPDQAASLSAELTRWRGLIQNAATSEVRVQREQEAATWMHGLVKTAIPTFSLQRGFEFRFAAERGERQCLLQSILISSMLRVCDVPAGVAMVFRNDTGSESNNGHVTAVMRGADGADRLIDASHKHALAHHKGLMINSADGYVFVTPIYKGDAVVAYRRLDNGQSARSPLPLDLQFAHSQVNFYRAERTPNGLMEGAPTPGGLRRSLAYIDRSIALSPANPLAVYTKGRLLEKLGERGAAHGSFLQAQGIYSREGWLPASVTEAERRTR